MVRRLVHVFWEDASKDYRRDTTPLSIQQHAFTVGFGERGAFESTPSRRSNPNLPAKDAAFKSPRRVHV